LVEGGFIASGTVKFYDGEKRFGMIIRTTAATTSLSTQQRFDAQESSNSMKANRLITKRSRIL
jgi:hypothetical protein